MTEKLTDDERARFERNVDRSAGHDACHPWLAYCKKDGYGCFWFRGKVHRAHRVAFLLARGSWPEPCVLHSCDNPACCNTLHMSEGTMTDNNVDMRNKGRGTYGTLIPQSRLTEQDVRDIRANYALCRVTQKELGARYGVAQRTISHVLNGGSWRHV